MALHKSGNYCDIAVAPEQLFDGNKTHVESITLKCIRNAYVDVDLESSYDISYIVLYAGEGMLVYRRFLFTFLIIYFIKAIIIKIT